MSITNHVDITITSDSVGVARAGFGVPLIISHNATFSERVRSYNSAADVAVDFAVTTSPEYLAAAAAFAQSPHPSVVMIGRAALQPTQIYRCDVAVVRNSHIYSMTASGEGVTAETITFTSDATATDGEIVVGLVNALNLVTGKNFTAAGATSPFTITGDAAGDWFSIEVDPTDLLIEQTHADPGIATDLAAIALENDTWYSLITCYNSNAMVLAAAAWVESNSKLYLADVNEGRALTVAVTGGTDTIDDIKTLAYERTSGCYHPSPYHMFAARWNGKCLPKEPGSITWKYKQLSGIAAVTLTGTWRANLVAKSGNSYETVAGVSITFEGTCSDADFIDTVRGDDWIYDDMSTGVFAALAGADKIPYTDPGVAVIEAEVRASLQRAIRKDILAADPAPVITVPLVADVAAADKTARLLPDVKWSAKRSGAIHKTDITGVVSI